MNKKRLWILMGIFIACSAYASTPATTAYVDEQVAGLRADITAMLNN